MRRILSLMLIACIAGVVLLGPAIFDMMPGHSGGCIASALDGSACPGSAIAFVMHHIAALGSLSDAVISISASALASLALLLAAALPALALLEALHSDFVLQPSKLRNLKTAHFYSTRKFSSWLSLLETNPACC
jgi:hypothetical protein